MYRLIWLFGLLGWTASLPAQDRTVALPDGTHITTHRMSLLGVVPASCIALEAEGGSATIVLPRKTVEWLAARDEAAVEDKISRLEFLASGRSRELLKSLASGPDEFGCQRLRGKASLETGYLVGWMLEQGHAAVLRHRLGAPEPAVIVRQIDTQISGYEQYLLLDGTVIWSESVWVS